MDKSQLIALIVEQISNDLESARTAALESAESATDEEARAENKYDTRGLESSYLASAQAHYAKELQDNLEAYHNLKLRGFTSSDPIALGAIVTTLSSKGMEKYFVGPAQGGMELSTDFGGVLVITPKSPLGSQLIGQKVGHKTSGKDSKTIIRVE
ncbi:GreA/GreB family elongation factor [Puniceicoccaceae bacterium K14]|nr:GreA/GreB family elongation factor [Puniceicoccaceae bacterium K14]